MAILFASYSLIPVRCHSNDVRRARFLAIALASSLALRASVSASVLLSDFAIWSESSAFAPSLSGGGGRHQLENQDFPLVGHGVFVKLHVGFGDVK